MNLLHISFYGKKKKCFFMTYVTSRHMLSELFILFQ